MKYERATQLQFWRFVAFLIIFQYHASQWALYQIDTAKGLVGVFFFVLLSGTLSSYSLHQKTFKNDSKGILDYKIKSIIRTYPLYIVTNCFTLVYSIPIDMVTSHNFKSLAKEFLNFGLVATMLQPWVLKTDIFNATSWYIASISWCGILCIPIHLFLEKTLSSKRPVMLMSLFAIGGVLYTALSALAVSIVLKLDLTGAPILYHPLVFIGLFVSGVSLGYIVILLYDRAAELKSKSNLFTILEILCTGIWAALILYPRPDTGLYPIISIVVDFFLVLVFMFGHGKISELFRSKPLVHLGNISFETYLIHQVVIFVFCYSNGWESFSTLGNIYALSICLFVTLIMSDFLHSMVGRRTMKQY